MLRAVIRNIILIGNTLFIALLLLSYLSWYLNPGFYWFIALAGLAYPYLLLINIGFIIFWLYRKRWYFLLSTIAIALGWNMVGSLFNFKSNQQSEGNFSVLSYNVKQFELNGNNPDYTTLENILTFVDSIDASVVCMQEFYKNKSRVQQALIKEKMDAYPYSFFGYLGKKYDNGNSIVTFSKYKIIKSEEIEFEQSFNGFIYTDLMVKGDTIRIYNCHLQSNQIDPRDIEKLDDFKIKYSEDDLQGAKKIAGKLKRAYAKRVTQVNTLSDHAKHCPYPFLIIGDFNDPPFSYTYHKLRQTGKDSFVTSGKGVSNTYQRKIRGFRIDYVFYSPQFEGRLFSVIRKNYSDHFPVKAILELKL